MLPTPTPRTRPRRPRVPPALTRGAETIPASPILDEIPGALGVLLWRSARNLRLWASTPPGRRGELFDQVAARAREAHVREAEPEAELLAPLSVIVRLLETPGAMEGSRLVNACRRLALWAERRGALGTALEFAQAAALTAPHVASLAYAVGRLARRRAEYDRAETWLARAVVQARRTADWRTYAVAYSGLGNLNVQKGNFPIARRAHERALRTATRHGFRDLQGIAYHDLFVAVIETGGGDTSALAEQALLAYGPDHPSLPRLAFDLAYQWILTGHFADALRIARCLRDRFEAPAERVLVESLIARSAGGAGEASEFDTACTRLDLIVASEGAGESAARALLGAAYGAASLRRWDEARRYGERALEIATGRREGRVVVSAEAALEMVRTRAALTDARPEPAITRLAEQFADALSPLAAFG